MPDKRKHRGRHPDDDRLFAPGAWPALRAAVAEYAWLLSRRYAEVSALKIVGDHHGLTSRQRMAVRRSTCSDQARQARTAKRIEPDGLANRAILIDGYNVLITVESALSGGLVFVGRDGCYRDIASVHGTYRKVEETVLAVELIRDCVRQLSVSAVTVLLDRPVKNSGRLAALIAERAGRTQSPATDQPTWHVELSNAPDAVLMSSDAIAATSDSAVLDRCRAWFNLAAFIVDRRVPDARRVDLNTPHTG